MKTALLIVDMQVSLLEEGPWEAPGLVRTLEGLVGDAQRAGDLVVFITDRRVGPDGSLHPGFRPGEGDLLIEKDFCDAFLGTSLDADLRARGIGRIVVAGLQTDYCIDTTCRRAASLGYRVLLVRDGHSTFPHGSLGAEQIIAHHNRILGRFSAGEGSVATLEASAIRFTGPQTPPDPPPGTVEPPRDAAPSVRPAAPGEEYLICALVERVFNRHVAPGYPPEGLREFYGFANPLAMARRRGEGQILLVAGLDGGIGGMIEMRNGNHVSLLFVETQGRGVARALMDRAVRACRERDPGLERITVNSSPYAEAVYGKLGFRPTGPRQTLHGITFIPMALALS